MEVFTEIKFDKEQDVRMRGRSLLLAFSIWCQSFGGTPSRFEKELCLGKKCPYYKTRGPVSCTSVNDDFNGDLKIPKNTKLSDVEATVAGSVCAMAHGLRTYLEEAKVVDVVRGRSF